MNSPSRNFPRALVIVIGICFAALLFFAQRPGVAHAGGAVVNCGDDAELTSKLAGGGNVTFNCGGAGNSATIALSTTKSITTFTTLDGGGIITLTGLNSGSGLRFFTVTVAGKFFVSNTVMAGGTLTNSGSGLYIVNHGTTSLFSVTLRNGSLLATGATGGAVLNTGVMTLTNSTVQANSVNGGGAAGGGIYSTGSLWLVGSTVSGNSSNNGGGIYSTGTIVVSNSTVSGNSGGAGGGINSSGTLSMTSSTVSGNSGSPGAGLRLAGAATIVNSTVSGNAVSNGPGGGINNTGALTLTNSTIVSNTAGGGAGRGGGISSTVASNLLVVFNTIIANNIAANSNPDCFGNMTSLGFNLSGGTTCSFTATGDVTNTAVSLGPLQNNGGGTQTHLPAAGSAAVDAGSCAQASDQRGVARPAAHTVFCDIGAVEMDNAVADLAVGKVGVPSQALPGRNVTYTISFSNTGSAKADAVYITDVLPSQLTSIAAQASIAAGYLITPLSTGPLTWSWATSDLRPGIGGQITFTAIVSPGLAASVQTTNTVTISGTGDITPTNNTATSAISMLLAPNVAVSKSVTPTYALPGQTVTYSIQVVNSGFAVATNVTLTDIVPVSLTQISTQSSAPITPSGGVTYAWQLPNLAVNAGVLVTISGVVSPNLRGDVNFNNTATASAIGDIFAADDSSTGKLNASSCFARVFDGANDGPLFLSVQPAVSSATTGQLVKVAGYCLGSANITTSLTLRGGYTLSNWTTSDATTNPATLDAQLAARVVNANSGLQISIEDMTLTRGRTTGGLDGGGILNTASVVTLTRVTVSNSQVNAFGADGGGIANSGTMLLNASTVASNIVIGSSGGRGAGIFNSGTMRVLSSTITSNSNPSGNGGGIGNTGTLTVTASTISTNTVPASGGKGGGIANEGILLVSSSAIVSNSVSGSSSIGGGVWNISTATLGNTTLSNNVADNFNAHGGGVAHAGGTLTLVYVTLNNNRVSGTGASTGGLFRTSGTLALQNTVVANSVGGNCGGVLTSNGFNVTDDATCALSGTRDVTNTVISLGPLQFNGGSTLNHLPLPGSAAVDAGVCIGGNDQRGVARPAPSTVYCDSGATELQNVNGDLAISKVGTPSVVVPGRPVTYTIAFSNTGSGRVGYAVITDVLPSQLVSVSTQATTAPGYVITPLSSGPITHSWSLDELPPGKGGVVTITAIVSPALGAGATLTNSVSITNASEITLANNSATSVIEVVLTPNVGVSKHLTPTFVAPGQTLTYVVQVVNSGFAMATNVVLTEIVPVSLTIVSVQSSAVITPNSGVTFSWQLPNLAVNGGVAVTITAIVSPNLHGVFDIANTAVASANGDVYPFDDSSTASLSYSSCFARVFDGVSDGPITHTVQGALSSASAGQLVKVVGYCIGSAKITTSLTMRGGYSLTDWNTSNGAVNPTTLDAVQLTRTVNVNGGLQVTLADIAFVGGRVLGTDGGGILNSTSALTLSRVIVRGNEARNFNADGGGVANHGTMWLDASIVAGNIVTSSTGGRGGGIFSSGALTVTGSAVISNANTGSSNLGGGLFTNGPTVITNTTISGNSADGFAHQGGGVYVGGGSLRLDNATLSNNRVTGFASGGGGISGTMTLITMHNTIIANSSGADCGGKPNSTGYNLVDDASCGINATGDMTNTAAVLGPLQSNGGLTPTHLPLPGSPAKNKGDNAACPLTDQRGISRPQLFICDIGAVEVAGIAPKAYVPTTMRDASSGW